MTAGKTIGNVNILDLRKTTEEAVSYTHLTLPTN